MEMTGHHALAGLLVLVAACSPEAAPTWQAPVVPSHLTGGFDNLTAQLGPSALKDLQIREGSDELWPHESGGAFGDIDGDGQPDVVLAARQASRIYRTTQEGGSLEPVPGLETVEGRVVQVADLDRDGHVDLLRLHGKDTSVLWGHAGPIQAWQTTVVGADPGPSPVSTPIVAATTRTTFLADLDRDGWLDIVGHQECCEFHCPGALPMLRTGPRTWAPRADLMASVNYTKPHTLFAFPAPDPADPPWLMPLGNPDDCGGPTAISYRATSRDASGFPIYESVPLLEPAEQDKVTPGSPMGVSLTDLNSDGHLDALLTLDDATEPYRCVLGQTEGLMTSCTASAGLHHDPRFLASRAEQEFTPWTAAFIDLDQDGADDVVMTHGIDPSAPLDATSVDQHEPLTAHWNAGDGRFGSFTDEVGLGDDDQSWRALVVGDLDADGDPDLIAGSFGGPPRLYRNALVTGAHGLSIQLRGTTSNRLGIGARVAFRPGGQGDWRHRIMGNHAGRRHVSQAVVFAGLGTHTQADVAITWPSGLRQVVTGLAAGQLHTLEEPPTLEVSPADRRLPSSGPQTAVLTLTAREETGAIRTNAQLALAVAYGLGSVTDCELADGVLTCHVPAPGQAGTTVVEATIDGVPMPIRPRLWWD